MIERKLLVGAAMVLFGAASLAQQSLTREEVQAELARAQAAGEIGMTGEAWDGSFEAKSGPGAQGRAFAEPATREEVVGELARARAAGELSSGEAWDGSFQPAAKAGVYGRAFNAQGLSRDAVRAELQRARESGELDRQRQDYVGGN